MRKRYYVESYDTVVDLIKNKIKEFMGQFSCYVDVFERDGIYMTIKPCFFYNGKFATHMRKKGLCAFIKIQLFPKNLSLAQAKREHYLKDFFSHRIIEFKSTPKGFLVTEYSVEDRLLKGFLERVIKNIGIKKKGGKDSQHALKENLCDVFRSFLFLDRYRTEVKMNFYGFDLHWLILLAVILLALLHSHLHYKLISG